MEKITYASLGSLGDDFHHAYETALAYESKKLGRSHPLVIRGQKKKGKGSIKVTNPADTRQVLGDFTAAGVEETRAALEAARGARATWQELGWHNRVAFLRKAADLMRERQFRLASLLTLEVGKNRFEAIAEVAETIDLILYYCQQMESRQGFSLPMVSNGGERTHSVLRPYGVWAVIAPFNFPLALSTGMAVGALLGGNTVVFKPASHTPLAGWLLAEILHEAGLPMGVFNFVAGAGNVFGRVMRCDVGIRSLERHDLVAGRGKVRFGVVVVLRRPS